MLRDTLGRSTNAHRCSMSRTLSAIAIQAYVYIVYAVNHDRLVRSVKKQKSADTAVNHDRLVRSVKKQKNADTYDPLALPKPTWPTIPTLESLVWPRKRIQQKRVIRKSIKRKRPPKMITFEIQAGGQASLSVESRGAATLAASPVMASSFAELGRVAAPSVVTSAPVVAVAPAANGPAVLATTAPTVPAAAGSAAPVASAPTAVTAATTPSAVPVTTGSTQPAGGSTQISPVDSVDAQTGKDDDSGSVLRIIIISCLVVFIALATLRLIVHFRRRAVLDSGIDRQATESHHKSMIKYRHSQSRKSLSQPTVTTPRGLNSNISKRVDDGAEDARFFPGEYCEVDSSSRPYGKLREAANFDVAHQGFLRGNHSVSAASNAMPRSPSGTPSHSAAMPRSHSDTPSPSRPVSPRKEFRFGQKKSQAGSRQDEPASPLDDPKKRSRQTPVLTGITQESQADIPELSVPHKESSENESEIATANSTGSKDQDQEFCV